MLKVVRYSFILPAGHALDYDRWEREGATGWTYADVLPYFKKSQTHELGEDDYRGGTGPQFVSRGIMIDENPLHNAFIQGILVNRFLPPLILTRFQLYFCICLQSDCDDRKTFAAPARKRLV